MGSVGTLVSMQAVARGVLAGAGRKAAREDEGGDHGGHEAVEQRRCGLATALDMVESCHLHARPVLLGGNPVAKTAEQFMNNSNNSVAMHACGATTGLKTHREGRGTSSQCSKYPSHQSSRRGQNSTVPYRGIPAARGEPVKNDN